MTNANDSQSPGTRGMPHLTLIFSRTATFPAAVIRLGGRWSHCSVVDGPLAIETLALRGGVTLSTLDEVIARSSAYKIITVPCPQPHLGLQWAHSTVGLKYDWLGALAIPFRERDWQAPDRWYCSEHVAKALQRSGLDLVSPDLHGVSPNMLWYLVHASGAAQ